MDVFVSHSHVDLHFSRQLVQALKSHGARVWYDEHSGVTGLLIFTIEEQIRQCPAFILVLSPAALNSAWVRAEWGMAYSLFIRDPERVLLPVVAQRVNEDDLWPSLQGMKRICGPGGSPCSPLEAARRTLRALSMNLGTDQYQAQWRASAVNWTAPEIYAFDATVHVRPPVTVDYGLPDSEPLKASRMWVRYGWKLVDSDQYEGALAAFERAVFDDPGNPEAWNGRGWVLMGLDRVGAARDSFERAVGLRPKYADARLNLAGALYFRGLFDYALLQCETVLSMPHGDRNVNAWIGKALVLRALGRHSEARKAESVADRLTAAEPGSYW